MPFQKGNKLAKGGRRPGSGRKSKSEMERIALQRQGFIQAAVGEGQRVGRHYFERCFESDAVLIDYRRWATEQDAKTPSNRPIAIQVNIESPQGYNGYANGQGITIIGEGDGGPVSDSGE